MKKRILGILLVLVISALFVTVAFAAEDSGISFKNYGIYRVEKPFDAVAATYEAWIKPTASDISGGANIISSINSTTFTSFRLSITEDGYLALKFLEKVPNGAATHKTYSFANATFTADEWTHVAVVCDFAAGTFSCYKNGELVGTKTTNFVPSVSPVQPVIGGSPDSGNSAHFTGEIGSITLFSDARTAAEVNADMENVDVNDANVMAHYDLFGKTFGDEITDAAGNYGVVYDPMWYDDASGEPADYAYSFAVIGDQQVIVNHYASSLHYMYDWILANKESKKIEYVFAVGDITDTRDNMSEWDVVQAQFKRLTNQIPLAACRGNHDRPYSVGMNFDWYTSDIAGKYDDGLENIYKTVKIGKTDYLIITLDYGPHDDVLAWANEVTAAHPDHKVIVVTHSYMANDGTTTDKTDPVAPSTTYETLGFGYNNGDQVWDKYVRKHENIVLVLSGHIDSDEIRSVKAVGDHGNVVTQMLIDPQGIDVDTPTGLVCMLYFNEDGNIMTTDYYSAIRNQYYNIPKNQYTTYIGERSGDMDNDGKITVADALAALNVWVHGGEIGNADINGDGELALAEVVSILKLCTK